MSYVIAVPAITTSAATDLATIRSNLSTAQTPAAVPTLAVLSPHAPNVVALVEVLEGVSAPTVLRS